MLYKDIISWSTVLFSQDMHGKIQWIWHIKQESVLKGYALEEYYVVVLYWSSNSLYLILFDTNVALCDTVSPSNHFSRLVLLFLARSWTQDSW